MQRANRADALENLALNATAAAPEPTSAIAIAWAACTRPDEIARCCRELVTQGVLRASAGTVEVYSSLGTTKLPIGRCFVCANATPRPPAVVCATCQAQLPRPPEAEIELMAAFAANPQKALNLADLASRTRANAIQTERSMLSWTQQGLIALDTTRTELAWIAPGISCFSGAGEQARKPPLRRALPVRTALVAALLLFVGLLTLTYLRLQTARKAASNRYWDMKSALGEHEQLLAPIASALPGIGQPHTGLSVGVDLQDHLKRAKFLNDVVVSAASQNPPAVKLDAISRARVDAFNEKFKTAIDAYNASSTAYVSIKSSVLGAMLCQVSRCTPFDPQASPF